MCLSIIWNWVWRVQSYVTHFRKLNINLTCGVPSIVFLVTLYGNLLCVHQLFMAVQFGFRLPMQVWFLELGRPNILSFVCLYLSLYSSFLLFGHFCVSKKKRKKRQNNKKEIYYIMTNIDTQETDYLV
jgi:hypothetical protein